TAQTQRLLADLDMFRFNTVNYRKVPDPPTADSTGAKPSTGELLAVINASPAPKFAETTEFGGTFVANLPGPFINVRLKTRNPFGGAEVLELGVRAGFEGQLTRVAVANAEDPPLAVYTTQLGATAALVLPQFLVPFNTNRFLTRYNPKTRFSLSETYVNRPEYTRSNFDVAMDYIWQRSAFHQYVFSPFVITLVNSSVSREFQERLDTLRIEDGVSLYRSFFPLLEPSFSFTSLYNSNDFNQTRDARYLRLFAEIGGVTRPLYQDALMDKAGLSVYDFARVSADYRRYHHLTPSTFFVWRLNGGIVHALTRTPDLLTNTNEFFVPYDKSFFAGGSTSLRAWQPRRLGPGGYSPLRTVKNEQVRDFVTEQPGELLLEGSVEYRFPIYNFIKGALFTDFGNVWGLQERKEEDRSSPAYGSYLRPGAQFQFNSFYRQIAVGSGLGIRFDFTFLILRLDIATKVYDPTAPSTDRWALRKFDTSANPIAFNLGIGYPF
ncbi:MAG: BamA/TamA family outer membrane protein, partial [Hymenobacter sp.]|nr:BamA/TamA family outer membrane protein [Hymenobacter sp.]